MATNVSDNFKAQMRKGFLEYCIMLRLSISEAYASDIMKTFADGGFVIVEGTLYPLLTRLKNNGFLAYRWEESTQGPPRKYYYLTSEGRSMLDEMEESYAEINNVINHIKCSLKDK